MPGESVPQGMWLPPRISTLYVAANNALDRSRAQCDFLCDGVADDVQINQALNALPAGVRGRVVLSEGTFTLADPIVIPDHYITLEGQGWATFIDGDGLATFEDAIVISAVSGCAIKNLSIQTENGGGKACNCIVIQNGANEFLIDRVYFIDSDTDAIEIIGTSINKGWITNCFIENADECGIWVDMNGGNITQHLIIKDNYIASTGDEGIYFGGTGAGHQYCEIQGNIIANCITDEGIQIIEGDNCNISGNILHGNDIGISLHFCTNCIVADNNVHDSTGLFGIYLDDSPGTTISGNAIENNANWGIEVDGNSEQSVVTGNMCKGNTQGGIFLRTCERVTVTGNNCDSNGDDGIIVEYNFNTISGNTCSNNGNDGIHTIGSRCTISGNNCYLNGYHGIHVNGAENIINDNYCHDNSQDVAATYHGIDLGANADKCQVNDNFCNSPGDSQEDGIHLETGAHNVQIVGNYCYNGMGSGIALAGNNDYCLIKDNYCMENDDYGIEIAAAGALQTVVENNRLQANVTGQILDSGTDTILPFVSIDAPNPDSNIGEFPAQQMLDTVDTEIRFKLHIPSDFVELVRAQVVLVPGGTGDLRRQVDTNFGKICSGEAYNANTDTMAVATVAVDQDDLECIDISAALDGIAAIDWVGVRFTRVGSDVLDTVGATVWFIGFRMQYV